MPQTGPLLSFGERLCHCFRWPMPHRPRVTLHRHDAHEFYLCDVGSGEQRTTAGAFPMQAGDLFLFPAGVDHIGNGGPDGTSMAIVLTVRDEILDEPGGDDLGTVLTTLCQHCSPDQPLVPLSDSGRQTIRQLMERLVEEFHDRPPGYRSVVRSLFRELLVQIMRDPATDPALRAVVTPTSPDERLDIVLRLLDTRYDQPWTVSELAQQTGLGRSRFHQIFHAATGHSPTAYLLERRIDAAKHLLADTDLPALDIALDVGFGSLSQFYDQFAKQVGYPPTRYRQRVRGS